LEHPPYRLDGSACSCLFVTYEFRIRCTSTCVNSHRLNPDVPRVQPPATIITAERYHFHGDFGRGEREPHSRPEILSEVGRIYWHVAGICWHVAGIFWHVGRSCMEFGLLLRPSPQGDLRLLKSPDPCRGPWVSSLALGARSTSHGTIPQPSTFNRQPSTSDHVRYASARVQSSPFQSLPPSLGLSLAPSLVLATPHPPSTFNSQPATTDRSATHLPEFRVQSSEF
jgi:hypothetical protein